MKNIVLLADYRAYVELLIKEKQEEIEKMGQVEVPERFDDRMDRIHRYLEVQDKKDHLLALQQELSRCKYEEMMQNDTIEINDEVIASGPFYHRCMKSEKQ